MSERPLILLVEDDFDVRQTVAEVLGDEGYDVVTAVDGEQALGLLRGGARPFVILLDLMMAGMNGFQFRAAQREDPAIASIPVIVMSADRHVDARSRELAADAFLKKPTQLEELLRLLERFRG